MTRNLFFLLSLLAFISCNEAAQGNINAEEKQHNLQEEFTLPELPKLVSFAGQEVAIDNFDIKERLDKELIVNTFYHSSTIQSFKRANRYFEVIEPILQANGVPQDFKYLCLIESGLTQAVSPSGAKGFWQFMPATAKELGLKVNEEVDERLHITKSTEAACEYLNNANDQFKDWVLTAAAYNRGVGGIKSDLEKQFADSYFDLHLNNETSRYVFRILALKIIFESPELYGFYPSSLSLYQPIKTRKVEVNQSISDLALWAKENNATYRMVKILNPWIRKNQLSYKGEAYSIELPMN